MLPRCSRSIPGKPRCSPQSTADHQLGDAVPRCPAIPSRNMAGDGDQAELCITPCAVGLDPRFKVSPHPRLRSRLFGVVAKTRTIFRLTSQPWRLDYLGPHLSNPIGHSIQSSKWIRASLVLAGQYITLRVLVLNTLL